MGDTLYSFGTGEKISHGGSHLFSLFICIQKINTKYFLLEAKLFVFWRGKINNKSVGLEHLACFIKQDSMSTECNSGSFSLSLAGQSGPRDYIVTQDNVPCITLSFIGISDNANSPKNETQNLYRV